jgi:hypothetical protein
MRTKITTSNLSKTLSNGLSAAIGSLLIYWSLDLPDPIKRFLELLIPPLTIFMRWILYLLLKPSLKYVEQRLYNSEGRIAKLKKIKKEIEESDLTDKDKTTLLSQTRTAEKEVIQRQIDYIRDP